ncbi:MAG: hypothetical protein NVV67_03165 [Pseudoxanthomonas sp.]|nr:hypothetical protein [Pseudoxanthomonas sp.]
MSQNLVDLQINLATIEQLEAAIVQMETSLAGLISLTPDQRRELTKMGGEVRSLLSCGAERGTAAHRHHGARLRSRRLPA